MSIGLKIKELRKGRKLTLKQLAEHIGIDSSQLSKIERDILKPTVNQIKEISSFFGISIDQLVNANEEDETLIEQSIKGIPLIPIDAMAGFGNGEIRIHENEVTDYYEVPLFEKRGAKYLIPVAGNSMYPKYASGDLLACKPLTGLGFVQWGKPYVLDTEQGAIVKRLFQHPEDESLLICKSDNSEHYPPFPIQKNDIYKVAIVVGVIRLE